MLKRQKRELPNINERLLKYSQVRVLDNSGQNMGVHDSRTALEMAQERDLDLILVTEHAELPIVRIDNYGQYMYRQKKLAKNKPRIQETKTLKISPRIADHDLNTVMTKAKKFLEEGDKVKLVCQFKARELEHVKVGESKLTRLFDGLASLSRLESPAKLEGRAMSAVLLPGAKTP